jgi:hypothetical protein
VNLTCSSLSASGAGAPVVWSTVRTCTVRQSDPPLDSAYASRVPSSEKEVDPRATVPSSESVLGSSRTVASAPGAACVKTTDWACRPVL